MPQRWYVIRTEPHSEYLAVSELEGDGLQIYFPRVKTVRPRPGHADSPLFPGYLFIRCDLEGTGQPSLSRAPHVSGWVRFGGIAPAVPEKVISELAQRVESLNREGGLWTRFRPGQKVRVMSFNLESAAEVVEDAKSPHGRVRVLLDFMGRLVSAQLPWQDLRPITDDSSEQHRGPRRTRGRGRWIQGFGPRAVTSSQT